MAFKEKKISMGDMGEGTVVKSCLLKLLPNYLDQRFQNMIS